MALRLNQIGQIALAVTDVDRAETFYEQALGLHKLYRAGDLCFFDCAGVRLMLDKAERPESVLRASVIYFRCPDIARSMGELKRRGVVFTGPPRLIAGMEDHDLWMAFFTDPDGHSLALMQEAPKGYVPPPC